MDLIGESSPLADAELVAAALDIMRAFGLGPADVQARISDRRVLRALLVGNGLKEEQLPLAYWALDKGDRVPRKDLEKELAKRLVQADVDKVFDVAALKGLDAVVGALGKVKGGEEAGEPLVTAVEALRAVGPGEFLQVGPGIVLGRAHYTGVVVVVFVGPRALP